jgi:hypothetical protein
LDVAAHGDPKLTGEMGWAAEVGGARSKLGKQTIGANETRGSYWCY